jgi:anti-sigma B factor antagonist
MGSRRRAEETSMPGELDGLRIDVSGDEARKTITITGELDIGTAPQLRDCLRDLPDETRSVELDLLDVTFIDSTALGVLLAAFKRYQMLGAEFRVSAGSPMVAKVLEISGLRSLLGSGAPEQPD